MVQPSNPPPPPLRHGHGSAIVLSPSPPVVWWMLKTGDMSKRAIVQTEYDTVLRLILQHTILFDKLKRCMQVNKKVAYPPTPAICRGSAPEKKLFQDSGRFPRAFLVASESNVRH